jgi:hypothetical protein
MKYIPDTTKPKAIIVDVDGTIAHMHNRGPFDWYKVGEDKFDEFVGGIVTDLHNQGYIIIFLSGRDDSCYNETMMWLDCHFEFPIYGLLMRGYKDYRKDNIVKKEIFFRDIAPFYNVHAVIDDRPQVVRMWHEIEIPKVICVGNPFMEF